MASNKRKLLEGLGCVLVVMVAFMLLMTGMVLTARYALWLGQLVGL